MKTASVFGIVLGVLAGSAAAQSPPPARPAPAACLERYDPHDWTLEVTVNVRAWETRDPNNRMPVKENFEIDTAAIVFPILAGSAAHVTRDAGVESVVKVNDRPVESSLEFIRDLHSGARLGKWKLIGWTGDEIELQVRIPATCWKTRFDEEAASRIDWPKGDWPREAQSTFDPQYYVDLGQGRPYDMTPVRDLLKRWTNGKDPRSLKPVVLAKYLAGRVWETVQPSGNGLGFNRLGQLEGVELQGAPQTAIRRRGSEFDMVCLLAAVYREAGLPARTVIGYDVGEEKDDSRRKFLEKKGSANLRAWVEFALYDESSSQVTWVPVDVVRMRKSSSRAPELERPWKYFGTHDELDGIIPFAFHFHPPTVGVLAYGSPGFWGWLVTPKPPDRAVQALRFRAQTTPRTAEPPPRR